MIEEGTRKQFEILTMSIKHGSETLKLPNK